jgi:PIN domain nuclease of toxin-antitoxin system
VLLLDTHVWIWAAEGDARRIGRRTRALLTKEEAREALRVSPVTLFELAALHTLGRIRLAHPLDAWIDEALQAAGIRLTELTPAMAVDAGRISREALADPLDRLLVATARGLDATLLTCDSRMLGYAASSGEVRVHDASR